MRKNLAGGPKKSTLVTFHFLREVSFRAFLTKGSIAAEYFFSSTSIDGAVRVRVLEEPIVQLLSPRAAAEKGAPGARTALIRRVKPSGLESSALVQRWPDAGTVFPAIVRVRLPASRTATS